MLIVLEEGMLLVTLSEVRLTLITIACAVVAVVPSGRVAFTMHMQVALPFFKPLVIIVEFLGIPLAVPRAVLTMLVFVLIH